MHMKQLIPITGLAFSVSVFAAMPQGVEELQHEWARIKYKMPQEERAAAFEALAHKAEEVSAKNTGRAEPLVWEAIILSSEAGHA